MNTLDLKQRVEMRKQIREALKVKNNDSLHTGRRQLLDEVYYLVEGNSKDSGFEMHSYIVSMLALLCDPDARELRKKYSLEYNIPEILQRLEAFTGLLADSNEIYNLIEYLGVRHIEEDRLIKMYDEVVLKKIS